MYISYNYTFLSKCFWRSSLSSSSSSSSSSFSSSSDVSSLFNLRSYLFYVISATDQSSCPYPTSPKDELSISCCQVNSQPEMRATQCFPSRSDQGWSRSQPLQQKQQSQQQSQCLSAEFSAGVKNGLFLSSSSDVQRSSQLQEQRQGALQMYPQVQDQPLHKRQAMFRRANSAREPCAAHQNGIRSSFQGVQDTYKQALCKGITQRPVIAPNQQNQQQQQRQMYQYPLPPCEPENRFVSSTSSQPSARPQQCPFQTELGSHRQSSSFGPSFVSQRDGRESLSPPNSLKCFHGSAGSSPTSRLAQPMERMHEPPALPPKNEQFRTHEPPKLPPKNATASSHEPPALPPKSTPREQQRVPPQLPQKRY